MKKNFIGLVLAAATLAGCQTAQKNNGDFASNDYTKYDYDFDAISPDYSATFGRNLASTGGVISDLLRDAFKATPKMTVSGEGQVATKTAFLDFVKASPDAASKKLRDLKLNELRATNPNATEKDIVVGLDDLEKLSAHEQGEIALRFLNSADAQNLKNSKGLRKQIETEMNRVANRDTDRVNAQNTQKLISDLSAEKKGLNKERMAKGQGKNELMKKLEAQLIEQLGKEAGEAKAAEIRGLVNELMWVNIDLFDLGALRNFTDETCQNLSPDVIKTYIEQLKSMRDELKQYAKSETTEVEVIDRATGAKKTMKRERWNRAPCSNIEELAVYGAEKTQNKLGREGVAGTAAVGEQCKPCNYLDGRLLTAVGFRMSHPEAPECKK